MKLIGSRRQRASAEASSTSATALPQRVFQQQVAERRADVAGHALEAEPCEGPPEPVRQRPVCLEVVAAVAVLPLFLIAP
jgi:hypothetical protein